MHVLDDLARIVGLGEKTLHQIGQANTLWARNLDHTVHGAAEGVVRDGGGDVIRCDRLHEGRREVHGVAVGARLSDAAEELEELGRMDDGVRNLRFADQLLLRDLAAEVATLGKAIGADHRQRHMVLHAGHGFRGQQVASRGFEELEHGLVLERRRVRHVQHHLRALQGLGQAFAGDGVHARGRRCGDDLMAGVAQLADDLRTDEARAADDNDLHDDFLVARKGQGG
ncbi:hypothetical protein D3C72_1582340 [compost metagenome]